MNKQTMFAHCTPQRVVAGLIFLPLLAYAFPPFLVSELHFFLRLLFWTGVIVLLLAATHAAHRLIHDNPIVTDLPARDLAYAAVILVMLTPSLWLLAWILFTWGGQVAPGMVMVANYGLLFAAGLFLVHRTDVIKPEKRKGKASEQPRLIRRLPASFNGSIYRLTVRDHNVDVVTSEGVFTIRSRFTDAIDEMEPVRGHCSHRSHWITDSAVVGSERTEGKVFLRLINGDLVPVSRKYKPMLEDDGLL